MLEALVEPCVLAGSRPGDTVLDPFAGSGTVLAVAAYLGRTPSALSSTLITTLSLRPDWRQCHPFPIPIPIPIPPNSLHFFLDVHLDRW